jgi:hypothetical protein
MWPVRCPSVTARAGLIFHHSRVRRSLNLKPRAMSMTSFFFRNSDFDCNVLVLVRDTFSN